MNKVLRLKLNKKGRDFICGDIHGNFHLLKTALKKVNFNPDVDRIIVVGDLVDRGKNSYAAKEWLKKDYFYSVIGNHDAPFLFQEDIELFPGNMYCMDSETGFDEWFVKYGNEQMKEFGDLMKEKMYPAIEIETENGLVGVVHAEVPDYYSWNELVEGLNNKDYRLFRKVLWDRNIAKLAILNQDKLEDFDDIYTIPDISYVFHGHTISGKLNFEAFRIGNRYYIDTCAYKKYDNSGLSLFEVKNPNDRVVKISVS